jgi:hypothetical protein
MNETDTQRSSTMKQDYHRSAMICIIADDLWASVPNVGLKTMECLFFCGHL